jgi:hypothetical protein
MSMPPNILFFLPDQHRPDWLGVNPALPLRTPNLDRLCAAGTRFTQAFSPSPVCAPARACLASGLDYEHCRVPSNRENYPLDQPTYYQRLRDRGYRVCGVGKFDLHKNLAAPPADLDWGLDGSLSLADWGFTEGIDNEGKFDGSRSYRTAGKPKGPYLNYLHQRGLAERYVQEHADTKTHRDAYVTALPDDAYCDNWLSENGLRFLRDFPADQPWHLVVNFTGPHNPMDVTQGMHDAWEGVRFPMPVDNTQADYREEDHQRNRRHYAAMIENIDRQVGRFIDAVRERGDLDRTLIVYSSDHGEMLGDHKHRRCCSISTTIAMECASLLALSRAEPAPPTGDRISDRNWRLRMASSPIKSRIIAHPSHAAAGCGVQSASRLAHSIAEQWQAAFSGKAASWTGISTPGLLGGKDPEAVRREVRHCIAVFGRTGFILGVTNSIRAHFRWDNTLAMVDEWKRCR